MSLGDVAKLHFAAAEQKKHFFLLFSACNLLLYGLPVIRSLFDGKQKLFDNAYEASFHGIGCTADSEGGEIEDQICVHV